MSGPAKARTWSISNGNGHIPADQQQQQQQHHHQQQQQRRDRLRKNSSISSTISPYAPSPSSTSSPSSAATVTSIDTTRQQHIATSSSSTTTHHHHIIQQQQQQQQQRPRDGGPDPEPEPVAAPSFLQPRIAAMLGVSRRWHPVLFALRLLSIVPAICLGFPLAIRFLLMLHEFATVAERGGGGGGGAGGAGEVSTPAPGPGEAEDRLLLTETMLAVIWCGCSGYLSFFFTDCLMSRWLINYTPSATAFRLVSVSALNGYLQSWTLHLSGSSQDPFLLLPTWITITSTLTMVYHITYRKINIRKETSISISVFSMASYLSMVALLIQQHWDRPWLELPFVALGCRILRGGGEVVVTVAKYANITIEH